MNRTAAIVGGGFSGLLTAIHLLGANPELTVRLVERAPSFARGRAYSTDDPEHLLNVRAANMSAFPERPEHFVTWLAAREGGSDGFVGRGLYGTYLQELLRAAVGAPGRAGRLLLEQDAVCAIRRRGEGFSLELELGRSFEADAVILAVGLPSPGAPAGLGAEVRAAPGFIEDPWAADLGALPEGEILLLGAGLTMVDVALSAASPARRFTALSRRGLLSRVHAEVTPAPPPHGLPASPARALHILRKHASVVGWRAALDSIRPLTPAIWRTWSPTQRRQFLRHLRPWWDVHRHRMAPQVGNRISALLACGDLVVRAGRLRRLRFGDAGFAAEIRPRGARDVIYERFAAVVNCTGHSGDLTDGRSRLLAALAADGFVTQDPLALGVLTDQHLRALDAQGQVVRGLYVVGPLTRWANWESVAIPDLRRQTAELAAVIAHELTGGRRGNALRPSGAAPLPACNPRGGL